MSTKANEEGVHRLLDIVVEEVSLVDRAANQRRFLVVKRSEEMDDQTETPGTETPPAADAPETTPPVVDLNATPESQDPTDPEETPAAGETPLALAVDVLEELTSAVERLGTLTDEDARAELGRLAVELRAAADHLAPAPAATPAEPPAAPSDTAGALAAIRDAVARLHGSATHAPAPAAAQTPAPAPAATPAAKDDSAAALTRLTEQVQALAGTVQNQQARLAAIEKRSGLPNSAAPGERVVKSEPESVGWPLDLNRPMDRDSIDKAVSFHDL